MRGIELSVMERSQLLLDAVLPPGAEHSLQRLQEACHTLRVQTDAAQQSLYAAVAAHYSAGGRRDSDADVAIDEALTLLPQHDSASGQRWSEAQQLRTLAAAHARAVTAARREADALALRTATEAVSDAERACRECLARGQLTKATSLLASCAAAVASLPASNTTERHALAATHCAMRAAVAEAASRELDSRVRLGETELSLVLRPATAATPESWSALWRALCCASADSAVHAASQRVAQALVATLCAPLMQDSASWEVETHTGHSSSGECTTCARRPRRQHACASPGHALRALQPLLAWFLSQPVAPDTPDAATALSTALRHVLHPHISAWAAQCAAAHPEGQDDAMHAATEVDRMWASPCEIDSQTATYIVQSTWQAQRHKARAAQLAIVRKAACDDMTGVSGAPCSVGGPWRQDCLSCAVPGAVQSPTAACFQTCQVPAGALQVAHLLDALTAEQHGTGATAAWHATAADLVLTYTACCLAPHHHAAVATPGGAMLCANAHALLAWRLLGLSLLNRGHESEMSGLSGVAAAVRTAGESILQGAVAAACTDVCSSLGEAVFDQASSNQGHLRDTLVGAVHLASRFVALAHDMLPAKTAARCSGQVWHALGRAVCDGVLCVQDISADDCTALGVVLDAAIGAAEGHATAGDGWQHLRKLRVLLDAPLRDIGADARQRTGLTQGFSSEELAALVVSLFEDSPLRREVLKCIGP